MSRFPQVYEDISMDILHQELTSRIIKAYYIVYNQLGYGFLEKVYERSMMIELRKQGMHVIRQFPVTVFYDDIQVGDYYADIIVDQKVIIELKAEASLHSRHEAQLLNYLKATEIEVGLLFNFGSDPQFSRKIFTPTNERHPRKPA